MFVQVVKKSAQHVNNLLFFVYLLGSFRLTFSLLSPSPSSLLPGFINVYRIQSICKKIASALGATKRIRHLIPFNVLINVYDSLIQPHFDYCNVVWSNCGIGLSDKLQRLQNRAARILMSANSDCNVDDLFLHWVGVSLNTKDKYRRLL